MLESCSVEKLHHNEGLPILFGDFVDGADVGMIESRGGFGFAAKTS